MKTLLKHVTLLPEYGSAGVTDVLIDGAFIQEIAPEIVCRDSQIVDCEGDLLIPAFYNVHCHAAMTLFRGYGEDLPLSRWLDERILPAEDRLTPESVRVASRLAIAEMLKNGIVSFSDMYMFEEVTAEVVVETGVKANLARGLVSFDPDIDPASDYRLLDALSLARNFNGAGDGRVKIDLSLHGEYTNVPKYAAYVAGLAARDGYRMQVHLSESRKEHTDCLGRHGKTPAAFFASLGVFDVPTTAAHCVWVTEEDMDILREKQVTAVHNPISNLKLGSGIMPYAQMKEKGVRMALGSDGVASNNRMDILRELQVAALLHKGTNCDPTVITAAELLPMATRNGALAQGREDCGQVCVGARADLVLINTHSLHNMPMFDPYATLAYSAEAHDVRLTMCDGRILYRDGAYTSIDEERLRADASRVFAHYFE